MQFVPINNCHVRLQSFSFNYSRYYSTSPLLSQHPVSCPRPFQEPVCRNLSNPPRMASKVMVALPWERRTHFSICVTFTSETDNFFIYRIFYNLIHGHEGIGSTKRSPRETIPLAVQHLKATSEVPGRKKSGLSVIGLKTDCLPYAVWPSML